LSTKIHAAGDALGNPVRLIGSPGQLNDIAFAHELIEGFAPAVTIAGKGYDADHLCDRIAKSGGEVVIPPKRNQTVQRPYDADLYKERNIIERFFNKLKQFRRVATRYDKLLANFMGFVKLAAMVGRPLRCFAAPVLRRSQLRVRRIATSLRPCQISTSAIHVSYPCVSMI
jgi:putative transposase